MILLGTLVNVAAVICGTLLGMCIHRISQTVQQSIMQGIGLATVVLGMSMAADVKRFLALIVSISVGSLIGEMLRLEQRFERWGAKLNQRGDGEKERVAAAFVTASLLFCVGPMTLLGSLESGLERQHHLLITKSMLDGLTSVIFASVMGYGVVFSAIPILIIEGGIALFASQIHQTLSQELLQEMMQNLSVVGGVLILAIGLNLVGLTKFRVTNMLPALVVALLFALVD